jgi:hypothetical protein
VLWLDKDCAAGSEEEAMQRGAVAALVAVAGQRNYDYLLPQRYKPLWGELQTKVRRVVRAPGQSCVCAYMVPLAEA